MATKRTKITLACTECKQRNYDTTKEKREHPELAAFEHADGSNHIDTDINAK